MVQYPYDIMNLQLNNEYPLLIFMHLLESKYNLLKPSENERELKSKNTQKETHRFKVFFMRQIWLEEE